MHTQKTNKETPKKSIRKKLWGSIVALATFLLSAIPYFLFNADLEGLKEVYSQWAEVYGINPTIFWCLILNMLGILLAIYFVARQRMTITKATALILYMSCILSYAFLIEYAFNLSDYLTGVFLIAIVLSMLFALGYALIALSSKLGNKST